MSGSRFFKNSFPDFLPGTIFKVSEQLDGHIRTKLQALIGRLEKSLEGEVNPNDFSIYTGQAGIALAFSRLHALERGKSRLHLSTAMHILERPLRKCQGKPSFMHGDAGQLAAGAVMYNLMDRRHDAEKLVERFVLKIIQLCDLQLHRSVPDEILYGRAGYLWCLLYLKQELGNSIVTEKYMEAVNQTFAYMIKSGKKLSRDLKLNKPPLMYEWHEKQYLGAAHGISGILYILMKVDELLGRENNQYRTEMTESVAPTVDHMLSLQFTSGNCPSSIGSDNDKLLHWCHGAPGWIYMFIQAYKCFGQQKYLDAAKACAEAIWKRGLLQKGYGICHGVAGNGYAFLAMYNLTQDSRYLYYASKFAEFCLDYGSHGCRTPDRPFSLFEGLAGTVCFLTDMLDPGQAKFPAFEL